jgi:hypothetical protein
MLPGVAPQVKYDKRIQCNNPPAPLNQIDAALAAGMPVIVKVDYSPVGGVQDHWIVLKDKQGSDYLIQDPWPFPAEANPVLLTSRYGFAGAPDHIILDSLFYDGTAVAPIPQPPVEPKPVPAGGLVVFASADQLALRTQPVMVKETLIERMPMGARMLALEDAEGAKAKIGQLNTWLEVQLDADGKQGFVAAWYVTLAVEDVPVVPPPPDEPPQPVNTGLIVYATGDGLALRTQPVISPATLIKRTPQNTQFTALDADDVVKQKIGVNGQWLHVQDVQGTQGYVAAWYLALKTVDPALGVGPKNPNPPAPPVEPAGEALVVRTTDEGVALRSHPVIAQATLIKRLPVLSELAALEPTADVEGKLGVVNQWINVRDITGVEGYIAAWYVMKKPLTAV